MSNSNKDANLKEKLKQALASTFRVISDDLQIDSKMKKVKNSKDFDFFDLENLKNRNDFIKARAETDSSALKKKFSKLKKSNFIELLSFLESCLTPRSSEITFAVELRACLSFSFKLSFLLPFFIQI